MLGTVESSRGRIGSVNLKVRISYMYIHIYIYVCVQIYISYGSFFFFCSLPLCNYISTCKMTTLLLNHFFMFSFLMISAGFPQRDQCGICHENSWKNQGDPKRSFLLAAGKHLLSTQLRIWGGGCGFYYTLIIPLGPDKESMILFFFFFYDS